MGIFFKHPPRAPLEYIKSAWLRSWIALVMVFLYTPLLVLIAYSFNDSNRNIVWRGFTFKWYKVAFENDQLREALFNSLFIAVACTIFSIILGTLAAFALWRFKFPMKGILESGLNLPIVVPEICMGVGVLMFFTKINWPNDMVWPLNLSQIIIAHTTFSFPFVAVVIRARLESFNKELEAAALDLGASEFQAFIDVIIPHIIPSIVAGGLLAFTLSLDDFVITFFASGPGTITFPLKVYSMVRFSVTPEVNAASTMIILITIFATIFAMKLQDPAPKKEKQMAIEKKDKDVIIRIENITKSYGKLAAVDNVNLEIRRGEFFALLGPSGCGKTTLLRMIAGFEVPTKGKIFLDGMDVSNVPPNKRPVNTVFQSYAVFPHLSVFDNVAYGLRFDKIPKSEHKDRVMAALEDVKLESLAQRMPDQMSGGQRQRVALARALVKRPKVLLLDEPLSALDAKLREAMRFELTALQEKVGVTFIMVTHDQDEALAMADRCAVMDKGRLMQTATPSSLYEFPSNRFVADFIGSVNIFEGKLIIDEQNKAIVDCEELGSKVYFDHGVSGANGEQVWVGIRPEKIDMTKRLKMQSPPKMEDCPEDCNIVSGIIKQISYLGSESIYEIELENKRLMRVSRPNLSRWDQEDFTWDDEVWLYFHGDSPVLLQN